MRIVEFNNGKFAIEKGLVFRRYLGNFFNYWWADSKYIKKFCLFETEYEARERVKEVSKLHIKRSIKI